MECAWFWSTHAQVSRETHRSEILPFLSPLEGKNSKAEREGACGRSRQRKLPGQAPEQEGGYAPMRGCPTEPPGLGSVETGCCSLPAEQSSGPAAAPPPRGLLASSLPCLSWLRAARGFLKLSPSVKVTLKELGHGITEEGAGRGLRWGRRGGRTVGWWQTRLRT